MGNPVKDTSRNVSDVPYVSSAVPITLRSSIEFTEKEREKAEAIIRTFAPLASSIQYKVDDELIGGFIIEIGDYVIDLSVKNELNDISSYILN